MLNGTWIAVVFLHSATRHGVFGRFFFFLLIEKHLHPLRYTSLFCLLSLSPSISILDQYSSKKLSSNLTRSLYFFALFRSRNENVIQIKGHLLLAANVWRHLGRWETEEKTLTNKRLSFFDILARLSHDTRFMMIFGDKLLMQRKTPFIVVK